jgi:phenylacetate-CoA ligase
VYPKFADYLHELESMERAPLHELALVQADLLEEVVRHAKAHTRFYRDRLACLFNIDGSVDLRNWREVPITERGDVIANVKEMRASNLSGAHGPVGEFQTSGTTGSPITVAVNGQVSTNANANLARLARWHGLDRARPLASIRSFPGDERASSPAGNVGRGWIMGGSGPHFLLHVSVPIQQQLEWLDRVKAPYLLTYPSNAMTLAEAVTPERGRKLGIEMVLGHAETVPDGVRELVQERFGARFASYYSCTEIGMIAVECPMTPRYHVALENVFIEFLDDNGREVLPGDRGRVTVTGLHNYAMPFIRYSLADIAVASDRRCICGRSLPVIEKIEGRIRNAFTFRDGTRVWPRGWLAREMRAFVPMRQYQMVQLDFERIELRYVPDGTGRAPDINGLNAYARKMMHPSVEIALAPMDVLPRGPSGKFEDFVSLVPPTSTAAAGDRKASPC